MLYGFGAVSAGGFASFDILYIKIASASGTKSAIRV